MFGYFGKSIALPGGGPPPPEGTEAPEAPEAPSGPSSGPPSGPPKAPAFRRPGVPRARVKDDEDDEVSSRLDILRRTIARRRKDKESAVEALHARQRRQAAYGRGETSSGRRSESEIAVGVSSGYYSGYDHRFGDAQAIDEASTEVSAAGDEVMKAIAVVKAVTKDLKAGVATRAELQAAMNSLTKKIKIAKELSEKVSQLEGYGEVGMGGAVLKLAWTGMGVSNFYHGYKRNDGSVLWGLLWGILGPIGLALSLAQGYGQPA